MRELGVSNVSPRSTLCNRQLGAYSRSKHRYHRDVSCWDFGKLSVLREIDLALQGGYKFYYMGKKQYNPGVGSIANVNFP